MLRNEKKILYFIIGGILLLFFCLLAQFIYIQSFVSQVNIMFSNVDNLEDWIKYNIDGFKKNLTRAFIKVDNVNSQFGIINGKVDNLSNELIYLLNNKTYTLFENLIGNTEKKIKFAASKIINENKNNTYRIISYAQKAIYKIFTLENKIITLAKNLTQQLLELNEQIKRTNNLLEQNKNNICNLPSSNC